jgi:hypothetical protein
VLPSAVNEGSHCFSSLSSLHTVSLFNFSYSGGWKVISHGFNLDLYVIDKVGNISVSSFANQEDFLFFILRLPLSFLLDHLPFSY